MTIKVVIADHYSTFVKFCKVVNLNPSRILFINTNHPLRHRRLQSMILTKNEVVVLSRMSTPLKDMLAKRIQCGEARKAKEPKEHLVTIHLDGGLCRHVDGLPKGYVYQVLDWDKNNTYFEDEVIPYIRWTLLNAPSLKEAFNSVAELLRRTEPR